MKKAQDTALRLALAFCGLLIAGVTIGIFVYLFYQGREVLSLQFFVDRPRGLPLGTDGGIFPALVGSLYLGVLSGGIAGILSILGAAFLVFYCEKPWIKRLVHISHLCLSGFPSILFGLAGYTMLVFGLKLPRSLLVAVITISVMIYPFISIRIHKNFEENYMPLMRESLSLGIPKSYSLLRMILPHSFPQNLSVILLGMAYGMGATAPVMFTGAVVHAGVPQGLMEPFMALPYHLYLLANDGISMKYAYGTACALIVLLFALTIAGRRLGRLGKRTEGTK